MSERAHRGWYKHDQVPHFDCAGLYQTITYRLNDSLPRSVWEPIERELRKMPGSQTRLESLRRQRIQARLDAGFGSCILSYRSNAERVMDSWRHFDGHRYRLVLGVVMPNHVHVLVRIDEGTRLGELISAWKSYTARRFEVPQGIGYRPRWQRGYWDRFIRDEAHFRDAVRYIAYNPVKAGLVEQPEAWPYIVVGSRGVAREDDPPGDLNG